MNKQKRNLILAAAATILVVVAIVLFAVLSTTGRGGERATLEQLYKGMYTMDGGGMPAVTGALLPSLQQDYYDTTTMGGTTYTQLAMWQTDAGSMVGDDVQVSVKVLRTGDDDADDLRAIKAAYGSAIEAYHTVAFQLTLTGSDGSQDLVGVLPMARQGGKWYVLQMDAGLMRVTDDSETAE